MPGALVDFHPHFVTDDYIASARQAGHTVPDHMPAWPAWSAEVHLALMDEAGIDKAILSVSSPGIHFGDDELARDVARHVNDVGTSTAGSIRAVRALRLPAAARCRRRAGRDRAPTRPRWRRRIFGDGERPWRLPWRSPVRSALAGAQQPPYDALRAPHLASEQRRGFTRPPGRLWFDCAGGPLPIALPALASVVGTERLLLGTDYCFAAQPRVVQLVSDLDSDGEWLNLFRRNAKALL